MLTFERLEPVNLWHFCLKFFITTEFFFQIDLLVKMKQTLDETADQKY